jgi:hypothetical protein
MGTGRGPTDQININTYIINKIILNKKSSFEYKKLCELNFLLDICYKNNFTTTSIKFRYFYFIIFSKS